MAEASPDILGLRATGKLTRRDYREVVAPRIRALRERFGRLKVLFVMDDRFEGWTLGAAWANTVLDATHRRDFDRIAMVGAPKWEDWCVRAAASLLMKGELRTFRLDQLADARRWLEPDGDARR